MLVCMVSDFVESVQIAFGEIVYQYHHNVNGISLIDPREDGIRFAQKLIQNHKDMMDAGLVCDHLTEERSNNYSWALAMLPNNFNAPFGERSAVAKPYFFFTVWDKKSFYYRVKFGIDDNKLHWERQYSFVTLDEQTKNGKYLYKEMFSTFLKRIGPEYAHTEAETFLREWSAPERVHDKDNPLTATLGASTFIETKAYSFNKRDLDELPRPCSASDSA